DLNHVVRSRLLLARGTDADVAGVLPQRGKIAGTEIAHAALQSTDEAREDVVGGAADFLQRLDALGRELARPVFLVVTVPCGAAGLHRRYRAHAAVLLIEFAVDLHDLARRLAAAGEEAAEDD